MEEDYPILQYFNYSHLPEKLRDISQLFATLALDMATKLPKSPEVSVGLRKLLEAKDAFVRAGLTKS